MRIDIVKLPVRNGRFPTRWSNSTFYISGFRIVRYIYTSEVDCVGVTGRMEKKTQHFLPILGKEGEKWLLRCSSGILCRFGIPVISTASEWTMNRCTGIPNVCSCDSHIMPCKHFQWWLKSRNCQRVISFRYLDQLTILQLFSPVNNAVYVAIGSPFTNFCRNMFTACIAV